VKSSYVGLGVVVLALAGLWYAGGGATPLPQSAAAAEQVRVSAPVSHENLTVFFVHGPDAVATAKVATLQEALEAGWAVVHEDDDNYRDVAVENRSTEYDLFIQEGDIIKGGKQDRMIAVDTLLPPKSGTVTIPVNCVEAGRWTGRGNEDAKQFNSSTKFAVGNDIRYANATYQQDQVWEKVKVTQDNLSAKVGAKVNAAESESSFQLALENSKLLAKIAEYEQALRAAGEGRTNVVGVVFVVNGKVTGAEVYGSNALFQKAWPKLLSSAATEAVAEKTDKPLPPVPSMKEVERFLAVADQPQEEPARQPAAEQDGRQVTDLRLITDGTSNGWTMNRGSGAGRSGATVNRSFQTSGGLGQPNTPDVGGVAIQTGAQPAPQQPAPNANPAGEVQDLLEVVRPLNRPAQPAAGQPATPGNRLNVNRVENRAGLVTEARDPARQNAVIHKSYIKK
jgi:hypothetical protein